MLIRLCLKTRRMGTLARPHIAIHREMDGQECPSYERIRVFKQSLRKSLSVSVDVQKLVTAQQGMSVSLPQSHLNAAFDGLFILAVMVVPGNVCRAC